jgi:hypothetical protein
MVFYNSFILDSYDFFRNSGIKLGNLWLSKKNQSLAFRIRPHSPTFAVLSQNNGCGDLLLRIETVRFSGYYFKKT